MSEDQMVDITFCILHQSLLRTSTHLENWHTWHLSRQCRDYFNLSPTVEQLLHMFASHDRMYVMPSLQLMIYSHLGEKASQVGLGMVYPGTLDCSGTAPSD